MCRVPISFLLAMARHIYQRYLAVAVNLGEDPDTLEIGLVWVRRWLVEVRLTSRLPNRKYKVKRWVLKERLCIF